jgi:hypothetical protein
VTKVSVKFLRTITDAGIELHRMMEYPGIAHQPTGGGSSFGADEWVEAGPIGEGPAGWPEWKIEDDLAYQQWLDDVSEPGVD